jgi:2-amino-4-hydroxy-6-hydroxymethyldihydropteridine diphosphokinase
MARVFLGLGSNIDAESNLRLAVAELRSRFGELVLSPVYRSAALGFEGADFLNLVVGLRTDVSPNDLLVFIEKIHSLAGRVRGPDRYTSRPLDIDLLLYGDLVDPDPPLRLPRRDVLEHSFVLRPLSEIAPDFIHPETQRSIAGHWRDFDAACHPLTPVDVIL